MTGLETFSWWSNNGTYILGITNSCIPTPQEGIQASMVNWANYTWPMILEGNLLLPFPESVQLLTLFLILIPTDQFSFQPAIKTLFPPRRQLLLQRPTKRVEMWRSNHDAPSPNWYSNNTTSTSKIQRAWNGKERVLGTRTPAGHQFEKDQGYMGRGGGVRGREGKDIDTAIMYKILKKI